MISITKVILLVSLLVQADCFSINKPMALTNVVASKSSLVVANMSEQPEGEKTVQADAAGNVYDDEVCFLFLLT